jgi:glycosyltransferase involved in cell wall biosynthesis
MSERKKLMLLVSLLGVGGAERHMVVLANGMSRRFDVVLVYIKDEAALLGHVDAKQMCDVICLEGQGGADAAAVRRLAAAIDRHEPAIIVCANTYPLGFAHAARWISRHRPQVMEIYHTTILQTWKDRIQMLGYVPLMWATHRLVYVCQAQQRYWRRRGVRARRESMVYNGVDVDRFDPAAHREDAQARRREYGFHETDLVVGLCAVMRPEKAHGDLLQALRLADGAGVRWKALLIGDGPLRAQIERQIEQLGLACRVVITGYRSDVRADLAACDVMSLVSVTETFSIAALEAMAMARPLIMSDVGGAREQVVPGSTGWLFRAGDVEGLARCLVEAADRMRLARMGLAARARAVRDYSVSTMLERYEDLLAADAGADRFDASRRLTSATTMDRTDTP